MNESGEAKLLIEMMEWHVSEWESGCMKWKLRCITSSSAVLDFEVDLSQLFFCVETVECYLLIHVVLIPRRYRVSSNARIGTWQVDGEASSGRHCLCVDGAALRVRCGEASLIVGRRRIRFVDCRGSRWNVALRVKVLPIVWLSDECRRATCRTMWKSEKKKHIYLIDLLTLCGAFLAWWGWYLRHSCGVVLSIIVTWRRCVVVQTSTWAWCWARLMGTLRRTRNSMLKTMLIQKSSLKRLMNTIH